MLAIRRQPQVRHRNANAASGLCEDPGLRSGHRSPTHRRNNTKQHSCRLSTATRTGESGIGGLVQHESRRRLLVSLGEWQHAHNASIWRRTACVITVITSATSTVAGSACVSGRLSSGVCRTHAPAVVVPMFSESPQVEETQAMTPRPQRSTPRTQKCVSIVGVWTRKTLTQSCSSGGTLGGDRDTGTKTGIGSEGSRAQPHHDRFGTDSGAGLTSPSFPVLE